MLAFRRRCSASFWKLPALTKSNPTFCLLFNRLKLLSVRFGSKKLQRQRKALRIHTSGSLMLHALHALHWTNDACVSKSRSPEAYSSGRTTFALLPSFSFSFPLSAGL